MSECLLETTELPRVDPTCPPGGRRDIFAEAEDMLTATSPIQVAGRVCDVSGLTVGAEGLPLPVGAMCSIESAETEPVAAQVVAVQRKRTVLMTLRDPLGVRVGDRVRSAPMLQFVPVGSRMLGRTIDGLGRPLDGEGGYAVEGFGRVYRSAPPALTRKGIDAPLSTGVRAIDGMLTVGLGQRMGIFAGTGVGKSVLMGMIARNTSADVTVVALIGERGREVGDFIRKELGDEGLRKTVLVVSTSDQSPVLRVRAAFVATAVAEYFRDQGANVLLLMDSTTRMAMAQRQIGLAAGEPPTTRGYPPSVFGILPQVLERAGRTRIGSITGLYTVLVEGDDLNDPIGDAVRGIIDGHIWLSRDLSNRGHYPAVSVLESISRVMSDVTSGEHRRAAGLVRKLLGVWRDIEDMVNIGAYAQGSSPEFDLAIRMKPKIDAFLQQAVEEPSGYGATSEQLLALAAEARTLEEQLRSESAGRVRKEKR